MFLEEIFQSPVRLLGFINDASTQSIDQSFRSNIHHHDFVRLLEYPIGNSLANANTRYLQDLIIQALEMLQVHCCQDVDPGIQEHHDVLPSLCSFRTGHIGVGKLIDCAHLRSALENRLRIHLFKRCAAVFHFSARNDFQPLDFFDGVLPAVRLEVAYNDIDALLFQLMGFVEHPIGFPGAGRVAEEYFEASTPRGLRLAHVLAL